jgi:REP-associated tyrosine transposase
MPHTYTQNTIHVIFSTKNREKAIPKSFQSKLWAYAAGICRNHGMVPIEIGGSEDHIHLLVQIPPTITLSDAISTIKANSSRWAHEQGNKFAWQQGYAAFSVSASSVPSVGRYVRNQEAHHKKRSFQEEWFALLKKHGVEFDRRYALG